MSLEIKIPELGENITGGSVANVLVSKGDKIEVEQSLIELETDKAVVEVPADAAGVVSEIMVKSGDEVKVGQVILKLDAKDGSETQTEPEKDQEPEAKPAAPAEKETTAPEPKAPQAEGKTGVIDINIPDLGDGIKSGTVSNVLVNAGDAIEKEQSIIELETEKAVVEVPCEVAGKVTEVLVKSGDEVKIGQTVLKLETTGGQSDDSAKTEVKSEKAENKPSEPEKADTPAPEQESQKVTQQPAAPPLPKGVPVPAAPSVRRFAREIGVDINEVKGSGEKGRISVEDVKAHSKRLLQEYRESGPASGVSLQASPLPDFSKWGEVDPQPMSKVREKTATHLSKAWATIPHVTQMDKADSTELETLRKQFGKKAEDQGGKLTMTAILLKICAAAIKVFPQFNASVDMANKQIVYKKYVNIGIAVDTDRGLLVPVIRNVDQKNIIELAVELTEIAVKARNGKLSLDDMQGGNFTISNLGGIGGTSFTPIVNAPEVAILGVSRGRMEPVYKDGEFVPRMMLPLSLSYDHRVIDGADGARFVRWIAEAIEQPFKIVLEG